MLKNNFFISTSLSITLLGLCYSSLQTIDTHQLEKQVSQWLNISDVSLQEIYGGLTNTSFMATHKNTLFKVRIGKKNPEQLGINRYCEIACQESASQIGIAPKIFYNNPEKEILICAYIPGKTLTKDDVCQKNQLRNIVQLLKICHHIPFKKEFVAPSIYEQIMMMMALLMADKKSFISQEEAKTTSTIIKQIEIHFREKETMYAGLCHCDLLPENLIDDGKQLWLIDWEYAFWNNILFDLASLCIESDFDEQQTKEVLELYFGQKWQEHYMDYQMMHAIFNLRNAFWYSLREKEIVAIGSCNMADFAKKHFDQFKIEAKRLFPYSSL